ncbi:1-aminocyclopropane-1-carboxylate deaminase/D-cysteine desulfhydrase [Psychromonas sp. RZ22]|uniref:1-aminocyclopropane-1-carboxylate deaminase/D-cysteine desulfhydrase n=1 Tax=Psychromonas algarum TaxID=2555643 RepID=UPI0010682378|nr:pyridoxal-phosphate dependent enzyme [Psychromonas sp. RZ22]TEW56744.1 1-aminocyclopropane-1-carboxylate deaminase/D-cysteine desulfhydrase [Psychromonas sp. RZ22]
MGFIEKFLNENISHSPLQKITHPLLTARNLTLSIKRDDLLHPEISGNKWRKLKYNLLHAEANNIDQLLSFGGAYSNHIHALSAAAYHLKFKARGIIRGEEHYIKNPTLSQAKKWGMQLNFVDRKTYRLKTQSDFLENLQLQFPNTFIIPEGGSNYLAIPGVEEVIAELITQSSEKIDHIFTATGSAGTLSGLVSGALKYSPTTQVHGIAVLKDAQYLAPIVSDFVPQSKQLNWHLHTQFHEGGYAKVSADLSDFCIQFTQQTKVPIEPIYTGKMLYALWQLIEQDYFVTGANIVALHTGGLQGLAGLKEQKKY